MRGNGVRGGDRRQLPPALMEHQVEPEEGLQPPAESRPGPARPLGDRADPYPGRAVEVKNAIRLAVADAPQDDRLRLVTPRHGHGKMTAAPDAAEGGERLAAPHGLAVLDHRARVERELIHRGAV